jgi:hypothetical protein
MIVMQDEVQAMGRPGHHCPSEFSDGLSGAYTYVGPGIVLEEQFFTHISSDNFT